MQLVGMFRAKFFEILRKIYEEGKENFTKPLERGVQRGWNIQPLKFFKRDDHFFKIIPASFFHHVVNIRVGFMKGQSRRASAWMVKSYAWFTFFLKVLVETFEELWMRRGMHECRHSHSWERTMRQVQLSKVMRQSRASSISFVHIFH